METFEFIKKTTKFWKGAFLLKWAEMDEVSFYTHVTANTNMHMNLSIGTIFWFK